FERKGTRKVAWIVLTVVTSLAVTTTIVTALHGGLTIIHLVALILVMGLVVGFVVISILLPIFEMNQMIR
ncbi:MAG: hypothetical protein MUP26_05020, partial [Desulfobulbaceae bacterium]|nr:hypothetical protein [Desulfobulbaceae bacterium]